MLGFHCCEGFLSSLWAGSPLCSERGLLSALSGVSSLSRASSLLWAGPLCSEWGLLSALSGASCLLWVGPPVCSEWGLLSAVVRGLLTLVASFVLELRLWGVGLQQLQLLDSPARARSCGTRALVAPCHVGSSWTSNWTRVSCICRQILYHWAIKEASRSMYFITQRFPFWQ